MVFCVRPEQILGADPGRGATPLHNLSYLTITLVTVPTVERANLALKRLPSPTIQNPEIQLRDIIPPPFQNPGSTTAY